MSDIQQEFGDMSKKYVLRHKILVKIFGREEKRVYLCTRKTETGARLRDRGGGSGSAFRDFRQYGREPRDFGDKVQNGTSGDFGKNFFEKSFEKICRNEKLAVTLHSLSGQSRGRKKEENIDIMR